MQHVKHAAFAVAVALTTLAGTGLAAGSEGESTFMTGQSSGMTQQERWEHRNQERKRQSEGRHGRNGAMAHRYNHQRRHASRHRRGG